MKTKQTAFSISGGHLSQKVLRYPFKKSNQKAFPIKGKQIIEKSNQNAFPIKGKQIIKKSN